VTVRGSTAARRFAFVVAALAFAASVRLSTFVPWGTDAASYVESAYRWTLGDPAAPSTAITGDLTVRDIPLGFRAGRDAGTNVSIYPQGYPVLMAAAWALAGEWAAYLVVPALTAVLVWAAARVASAMAGAWAGLLAALLVALSPVTLLSATQPMSDVPSAAFWLVAWVLSLRTGLASSATAGAATAAAIAIRPNLAPLAVVPAWLLWMRSTATTTAGRVRLLALFAVVASLGPAFVLWTQAAMYGHPLEPGYPGWEAFYRLAHIPANIRNYPRFLFAVHTPLVLLGLASPLLIATAGAWPGAGHVAWSGVALTLLTFALYLPYLPYDDPHSLRFTLPAVSALFVLLAVGTVVAARGLARRLQWLAPVALVPVLLVAFTPAPLFDYVRTYADGQRRVALMGKYLQRALPSNAVVLAFQQSGAVAHYTRAPIVRHDLLDAATLDDLVTSLTRHGYRPTLVIDEVFELADFRARFAASSIGRLGWRPRARAIDAVSSLLYFDLTDAPSGKSGDVWATDVVRRLE
jgi:4-amino-4-deoxy-L-arabinose transferase-like glycosyltransferase